MFSRFLPTHWKQPEGDAPNQFFGKANLLFLMLGGFFITNALIAEFVGVKVFSLEKTLGLPPANLHILGFYLSFNLTAGALLWPLVFVMSDLINEYFGRRGVRLLSYLTIGLIAYTFLIIFLSMSLTPADFWIIRSTEKGPLDMDMAFNAVFGQGLWIIVGSLIAFFIGQVVDVAVFYQIKLYTGEKYLWLRATGSTLISQLIDSFVVLIIAFHLNPSTHWDLKLVIAIGIAKYIYKFLMAVLLTPIMYLMHAIIDHYLGAELATYLKERAMTN
jgi:uncharacterized integral membrane protein (TIGR00697 family)